MAASVIYAVRLINLPRNDMAQSAFVNFYYV